MPDLETWESVLAKFGVAPPTAPVRRRKPVTRVEKLTVTEISLVPTPANQHARVVLFKAGEPAVAPPAAPTAGTSREALLGPLRALGRAAADAMGFEGQQLDPATLLDLGLAAPGGAAILLRLQATDG